jgi:hypothetical protein
MTLRWRKVACNWLTVYLETLEQITLTLGSSGITHDGVNRVQHTPAASNLNTLTLTIFCARALWLGC